MIVALWCNQCPAFKSGLLNFFFTLWENTFQGGVPLLREHLRLHNIVVQGEGKGRLNHLWLYSAFLKWLKPASSLVFTVSQSHTSTPTDVLVEYSTTTNAASINYLMRKIYEPSYLTIIARNTIKICQAVCCPSMLITVQHAGLNFSSKALTTAQTCPVVLVSREQRALFIKKVWSLRLLCVSLNCPAPDEQSTSLTVWSIHHKVTD